MRYTMQIIWRTDGDETRSVLFAVRREQKGQSFWRRFIGGRNQRTTTDRRRVTTRTFKDLRRTNDARQLRLFRSFSLGRELSSIATSLHFASVAVCLPSDSSTRVNVNAANTNKKFINFPPEHCKARRFIDRTGLLKLNWETDRPICPPAKNIETGPYFNSRPAQTWQYQTG